MPKKKKKKYYCIVCDVPILPKRLTTSVFGRVCRVSVCASDSVSVVEADFSTDYLAPAALELLFHHLPQDAF